MINDWILNNLDNRKDSKFLLVKDPLSLTKAIMNQLHVWGKENDFCILPASTNLAFRWKYELSKNDNSIHKMLILDNTPNRRLQQRNIHKASQLFYPDILSKCDEESIMELDLRKYLIETTNDESWPVYVNEQKYARLIIKYLDRILKAYSNLRKASRERFTDQDFQTIIAYAILGLSESAFKKLDFKDYWKIGMLKYSDFQDLGNLAPSIIETIKQSIREAPSPFKWFADYNPETVIKAYYLSLILSQHTESWNLLLANIDTHLHPFSTFDISIVKNSAQKIIELSPKEAAENIQLIEESFSKEALELLINQVQINKDVNISNFIKNEMFSVLFRSIGLLLALGQINRDNFTKDIYKTISKVLENDSDSSDYQFLENRNSEVLQTIEDVYTLLMNLFDLANKLDEEIKKFKLKKISNLNYNDFWKLWNIEGVNRIEFDLANVERVINTANLYPLKKEILPNVVIQSVDKLKKKVATLSESVHKSILEINSLFQELIKNQYSSWTEKQNAKDNSIPLLTPFFLEYIVKPNWDSSKEKAVILIFDGMRYDIWETQLKPLLLEKYDIFYERMGCALLPSETHISRKAISSGKLPNSFDSNQGEDALLNNSLPSIFGITDKIQVMANDRNSIAETVRFRAGNLDIYIFDLCDSELHKIPYKTLQDGTKIPSRSLAFIYQQSIRNILDNEVKSVLRNLEKDVKIFITADHGFNLIGLNSLQIDITDVYEGTDCKYLNCYTKEPINNLYNSKTKNNVVAFVPEELKLSSSTKAYDKSGNGTFTKKFNNIIFPKPGFAFKRPNANFNPDAFSHGGISIQELMIPMIALSNKKNNISNVEILRKKAPSEILENEDLNIEIIVEKHITIKEYLRTEIQLLLMSDMDMESSDNYYSTKKVEYLEEQNTTFYFEIKSNQYGITDNERREGRCKRKILINLKCVISERTYSIVDFILVDIILNTDRIVRRVGSLGNILGLVPKRF